MQFKLTINNKPVNKISGPVSMGMFEPTKEYLERFPYAPIFILFGDMHDKATGFCSDEGKEENGEFTVYNPAFLNLLSDVVKAKNEGELDGKVDFYVEGGALHLNESDVIYKVKDPLPQLWNLFKRCYTNIKMDRKVLDINKPTCNLIPNIRWQSGDVRFFPKEKAKVHLYDFVKYLIKSVNKQDETKKFDIFKSMLVSEMKTEGIHKKYLSKASFTVDETYNEYVENEDSLIYRQLCKIEDEELREDTKQKFRSYIESNYTNNWNPDNLAKLKLIHDDIMKIFTITDPHSEEGKNIIDRLCACYDQKEINLHKYLDFLIIKRGVMLDLYTLARVYKTMVKSMNKIDRDAVYPLIVIFYFGKIHITQIATDLYNSIFNKDKTPIKEDNSLLQIVNQGENRCIDIINYLSRRRKTIDDINNKINILKEVRENHLKKLIAIKNT